MKNLVPIALATLMAASGSGILASESDVSPLNELVDAERAFSRLSTEGGTKAAFLTYLCDDGIVFEPGPLVGKHVWKTRANPQGTLRWTPGFAEVAADGDLGFTTGPWEFDPAPERKGATRYGDFVSVWKRGKDRRWCVAADIGVSHERTHEALADVKLETGPTHPKPARKKGRGGISFGVGVFNNGSGLGVGVGSGVSGYEEERRTVAHAINTMMSTERSYAFDLRKLGVARAYPKHAAEDVRFYREGAVPVVGMTPAIAVLARRVGEVEWRTFGSGVSTSADLGYSYGLQELRSRSAARPDTSAYVHIWRRGQDGRWKLALDIESEFLKR